MNVKLMKAVADDTERLLEIQKICFASHLDRYQDYETNPAVASFDRVKWQIDNENFYKILYNDLWIGSNNIRKLDDLGIQVMQKFYISGGVHVEITDYKSNLIKLMVKSGVLMFGDFTTKSGRQSPYFINSGYYKTGAQAEMVSSYYAALINEKLRGEFDVLFGPAYKGIPLCSLTSAALWRLYKIDVGYCFNRKEVKDHGEGGIFVGWQPTNGDRFLIIEDVISAGTSVREVYPLIKAVADVSIPDMVISVDRMERGYNGLTSIDEMKHEFGINVHSLVTVIDIIDYLQNREIDGKVYINDVIKRKMEDYINQYCAV